jgi:AmiR/NasT family two-component response regulator
MADAATIAVLQYRLTEERRVTSLQLERALDSRVVIEQGKGVLASRLQVSEHEAFELLRNRARATRRSLTEVADEVRRRPSDTEWNEYRHADPRRDGHSD